MWSNVWSNTWSNRDTRAVVECAGGTLVARRPEGDPDCIVLSTAVGI
jgi:hypothetical protein